MHYFAGLLPPDTEPTPTKHKNCKNKAKYEKKIPTYSMKKAYSFFVMNFFYN